MNKRIAIILVILFLVMAIPIVLIIDRHNTATTKRMIRWTVYINNK